MDRAEEEAFRAFVTDRSKALLRLAYLLVDGREAAEDLLQTALVKTYAAWHRIRDPAAVEGYVRRTLATTAISVWRGRRLREQVMARPPDRTVPDHADERTDRDWMWEAVRGLPAKQRAVIALRYYEDLSEAEIASTLGISRGAVKSHAARGLATLRERIADREARVRP